MFSGAKDYVLLIKTLQALSNGTVKRKRRISLYEKGLLRPDATADGGIAYAPLPALREALQRLHIRIYSNSTPPSAPPGWKTPPSCGLHHLLDDKQRYLRRHRRHPGCNENKTATSSSA
jgi:hypothetical protein